MKAPWFVVMAALALASCASAKNEKPERAAREIVSGAGRIRGGGVRMDVSVGHAFSQRPVKAGTAAVKQGAVTP